MPRPAHGSSSSRRRPGRARLRARAWSGRAAAPRRRRRALRPRRALVAHAHARRALRRDLLRRVHAAALRYRAISRPTIGALDRHFAAPLMHELAHGARHRRSCRSTSTSASPAGSARARSTATTISSPRRGCRRSGRRWRASSGRRRCAPPRGERRLGRRAAARARRGDSQARAWADYLAQRPLHLLSDADRARALDEALLPRRRRRAARRGHVHGATSPSPRRGDADEEILDDALAAMCLRNYQIDALVPRGDAGRRRRRSTSISTSAASTAAGARRIRSSRRPRICFRRRRRRGCARAASPVTRSSSRRSPPCRRWRARHPRRRAVARRRRLRDHAALILPTRQLRLLRQRRVDAREPVRRMAEEVALERRRRSA